MKTSPLRWTRALLVLVALTLTAIGILFAHSTTSAAGAPFPSAGARGQIYKALVAFTVFVIVSRIDYRVVARFSYVIYGLLMLLLLALLLRPRTTLTARWIDLGSFQLQPSEFMKVAVILCLAQYLRFRESYRRISGLVAPYALVFVPMGLVALQPDLGTSLMLPPVLLALLYVARSRLWPLLVTVVVGVGSLPAAFYLRGAVPVLRGYQLSRITDFFEQEGYQFEQSLISLGSGGVSGRGWGQGMQNTLNFLPEKRGDFIFSVIGEEWGFVGTALVVFLYATLVFLCIRVAIGTREPFGRLAAAGVGVVIAAQSLQNIGMTVGITPITGLPLPFVSHGGSSLVSSFLALALVTGIASHPVRVVASQDLDPRDLPRFVRLEERQAAGAFTSRWPV